jgi:hypothetical protein
VRDVIAKSGFPDVVTLHAVVTPPTDVGMLGTEIRLCGLSDFDVAAAKGFSLRYGGATPLEST